MGVAIIKNVVDDPSKEFIEIEDSKFVYCFKDVEREIYCRKIGEIKYRDLNKTTEQTSGRLFCLINPNKDPKEEIYISNVKEGMNLCLLTLDNGTFDNVALLKDAILKYDIDVNMALIGFSRYARIKDEDFDGDITKYSIEKFGGIFDTLKNIIIRRDGEIVLSCKSLDSYYLNYSKELPWYASENVKLTDVIRLAKEMHLLKFFIRDVEPKPEEPVYEYSNDIS